MIGWLLRKAQARPPASTLPELLPEWRYATDDRGELRLMLTLHRAGRVVAQLTEDEARLVRHSIDRHLGMVDCVRQQRAEAKGGGL